MTTTTRRNIIACTLMIGLLALCASSFGAEKWPKVTKGIKVFSPPEDQTVPTNGTACFTVVAEPLPLGYQWKKNGTSIPGATGPSYIISNVQPADVGFYSVVVVKKHASVTVKSMDAQAPGARLFVLIGTNTAICGPVQPGSGTKSCVGSYTGAVVYKNPSNSTWWTPPTGSTNCTISDLSRNNYNPPYVPVVQAVDNITLNIWCATNQVAFPVTGGHKYQFSTYIKNSMPPPNTGDNLSLDIAWAP